jgi:hypothetical protein
MSRFNLSVRILWAHRQGDIKMTPVRTALFAPLCLAGVVAAQTAPATGEVDIVIGGGAWLTAVLDGEQPGYLVRPRLYPAPNAELEEKMHDLWLEALQQ